MKKISVFYYFLLFSFSLYIVLDTFLISDVYLVVNTESEKISVDYTANETSYKDENMTIVLTTYREYDTNIYVADIILNSPEYLKTAFAKSSFGKNITSKTSEIAQNNNAILAINGDYYGVQESGYVLKNGVIYRSTIKSDQTDLVIYQDGSWQFINEGEISLQSLLDNGAYNVLSFGPSLIENSIIQVSETAEVGKAMYSNPRTAIGMINKQHYVFIVSDGRTNESEGLSLYELASFMSWLNVTDAYNLDGGGSSTMYFNGNIINNPTTNGKRISERGVSDIVYIGY